MRQDLFASKVFHFLSLAAASMLVFSAALQWLPSSLDIGARQLVSSQPQVDPFKGIQSEISEQIPMIAERPVFDMSRRPPVIEVIEEAPPPEVILSLVGILDSDTSKIALFRLSNRPDVIRLRAGQVVDEFRVMEITDSYVKVRKDDGQELTMMLGQ